MSAKVEWAVLCPRFSQDTQVLKGGLGSPEEAEAWLAALTLTQRRLDMHDRWGNDGITAVNGEPYVGWREVPQWQHVNFWNPDVTA